MVGIWKKNIIHYIQPSRVLNPKTGHNLVWIIPEPEILCTYLQDSQSHLTLHATCYSPSCHICNADIKTVKEAASVWLNFHLWLPSYIIKYNCMFCWQGHEFLEPCFSFWVPCKIKGNKMIMECTHARIILVCLLCYSF